MNSGFSDPYQVLVCHLDYRGLILKCLVLYDTARYMGVAVD